MTDQSKRAKTTTRRLDNQFAESRHEETRIVWGETEVIAPERNKTQRAGIESGDTTTKEEINKKRYRSAKSRKRTYGDWAFWAYVSAYRKRATQGQTALQLSVRTQKQKHNLTSTLSWLTPSNPTNPEVDKVSPKRNTTSVRHGTSKVCLPSYGDAGKWSAKWRQPVEAKSFHFGSVASRKRKRNHDIKVSDTAYLVAVYLTL